MQNEYRLIALDMDGTLLNSRHEITPRAKRAIEKILARGKQVVFSTGRCIGEMETYLEAFPGMRYLICESGACVYDLQEKKNIARIPISPRLVCKIISCIKDADIMASFFMGNRSFMDAAYMGRLEEFGLGGFDDVFDRSVVRVAALFDFYQENPLEVEKINLFSITERIGRRRWRKCPGFLFPLQAPWREIWKSMTGRRIKEKGSGYCAGIWEFPWSR